MMTAKINFITNNLLVDMTCRENELRSSLQNIGILIVPNMIYLDNRRTLQIQLNANDEVGEIVKTLINTERDTLGTVQRLCRSVYCLNAKHRAELIEMIENGEITTAAEGIEMAKQLLADDIKSISDISAEVGFDNFSYFSTVFKKYTGITPGEYRRSKKS